MPATPYRSYPYPDDSYRLDVTGDFGRLGNAIDFDVNTLEQQIIAEQNARSNADVNISASIDNIVTASLGGVLSSGNVLIQGAYVEATLDGFAVHVLTFPEPFGSVPIVIANQASSSQHIAVGQELVTTTTANIFGRLIGGGDGGPGEGPAYHYIVAYHWIAIGFRHGTC